MSWEIFRPSQPWPEASRWELLPEGRRWLTVQMAPVPYLLVRPAGATLADAIRAMVGVPVALDPRRRYQLLNIADPEIDLLTAPAPTDASFAWLMRKSQVVLSDVPVPGGHVHHSYRIRNANAAGATILNPVRWTTRGLTRAVLHINSDGIVPSVQARRYDPDNAAPLSNYPYQDAALTATTGVQFVWGEPLSGTVSFPEVPAGLASLAVFTVTTTPGLDYTFHGWIGR